MSKHDAVVAPGAEPAAAAARFGDAEQLDSERVDTEQVAAEQVAADATLAGAIADFAAGGYRVERVVHAVCGACGGRAFRVEVDDDAGCARRTCVACEDAAFVGDSGEHWDEAEPGECECPCGGGTFAVAAGFALLPDGEIRWLSVGLRCLTDGAAGVYTDWKIDYGPSRHLLQQV